MADDALVNAEKMREDLAAKINAAQQQIEDWRRDLRRAELFIADWHAFAEGRTMPVIVSATGAATGSGHVVGVSAKAEAGSFVVTGHSTARAVRRYNSPKEEVAAAARKLILEHGEPMSRTDLYRELIVQGLKIDGKVPEMVLSTMLWRAGLSSGVVRLKSGGYSLIEWVGTEPLHPDVTQSVLSGLDDFDEEAADSSEA